MPDISSDCFCGQVRGDSHIFIAVFDRTVCLWLAVFSKPKVLPVFSGSLEV